MSMHVTHTVYCDDCGEHNSPTIGTRTRSDARDEARRGGFVRRRLVDGWADLCPNCDGDRAENTSAAKLRSGDRRRAQARAQANIDEGREFQSREPEATASALPGKGESNG